MYLVRFIRKGVLKFIICILFYNACQRILYSIGTVHLDYQHIIENWQTVRTSLTICLRDKYQHLMRIFGVVYTIRIYHGCEGRIEKSVPRIAFLHQEACRVMTNGDPEGRNFLSYPYTNNGFFCFLLITVFSTLK